MSVRLVPEGGPPLDVVGTRIASPDLEPDHVVGVGAGAWSPGLINAHDHLHRNHFPRLGTPPYPDAYAWGRDLHARYSAEIAEARRLPTADALLFGALKNVLGGVTACAHHDPWHPGLDAAFPLRVIRTRVVHSLDFEPDPRARALEGAQTLPLCMHLAEGVTPAMAGEIGRADDLGLLDEQLLAVHAVGVDPDGIALLRARQTAVVWCPSSNIYLFGRTAPSGLLTSGVDILLGTDSLLTADGTMLDELAVARRAGPLDDRALLEAVGATAARRLGLPLPSLAPGAVADVVLWRRPLLEATPADVRLVLVAGRPVYGDASLAAVFRLLGVPTEALEVDGTPKLVAAPLADVLSRVEAISPSARRLRLARPASAAH